MAKHRFKRFLKNSGKTRIIAACLVALIIIGGLGYLVWGRDTNNTAKGTAATSTKKPNAYVNLNPPTAQDEQSNNARKDSLGQQTPSVTTPTGTNGKKQVTPIITSPASSSAIDAYIAGIFEDGGTCTATATNTATSAVVTNTSTGFENASYTSCPPITLNLSSGTWNLVVSYSSSDASGSSSAMRLEIQ